MFQSTRPRGARPKCGRSSARCSRFQSTRPRGARLHARRLYKAGIPFQSTRPRGARLRWPRSATARSASFNPRARAGRDSSPYDSAHSTGFNPRARAGRDTLTMIARQRIRRVSIHAPARGATSRRRSRVQRIRFQSTRPRGARPDEEMRGESSTCFNPRARAGRDRAEQFGNDASILFQSTRPRGARPPRS